MTAPALTLVSSATRICRKCGQERAADEFPGAHRQCRACRGEGHRAWKERTGHDATEAGRAWTRANHARHLWSLARRRAASKGLPFDLAPEDIFVPEFCPVLGLRLVVGLGKMSPDAATLDRIVPELGYVRGNVAVISWRANCLKRDATAEELGRVAAWIRAARAVTGG